jgi:UDP-perosamine 4-acetyltransferase
MNPAPVIILGAGGHAKVVADALIAMGREVRAFAEASRPVAPRQQFGFTVGGGDDFITPHKPEDIELALGIGMPSKAPIAGLVSRLAEARRFEAMGYRFATVIHPSAVIGAECEIAQGAQVMAGAIIQPGCHIGEFAIVNTRASVDHDCRIGEGSHVAPGAVLGGAVKVSGHALVGIGAAVRQGLSIGRGALVAGGAMMVEDVQEGETKFGVLAR